MYSAAVSSSRLPVTTMTGVSGAARSAMRSASAAPNVGSEWSVRMMSGAKVCSASRYARSESTRRAAPLMPAQHFQPVHFRELQIEQNYARRDADVAQRMALLAKEEFQGLGPVASHEHLIREIPGLEGAQGELHVARVVLDQQDLDFRMPGHAFTRRGRMEGNRGMHTYWGRAMPR